MLISGVESTNLFTGPAARPLQIVRVRVTGTGPGVVGQHQPVTVRIRGRGVETAEPGVVIDLAPGAEATTEVAVRTPGGAGPGTTLPVLTSASWAGGSADLASGVTVAEPGWTMWMVSHFHYDPVWWSTQGQFTQARLVLPDEAGQLPEVRTAFELVKLHLEAARRDPDYKFVLAEIDYLKPHFDAHPEDRADLLGFIKAGRIELVGGSYNEPNTNLTCAESTIRNAVYGLAYQREVLGGDPRTAWMLDAFGFDPGYPGIMAAAGLTESAWARGPFHQWGPHASVGDNRLMQFASEFEWLSPDGTGLLTSYMANHYSAGWLRRPPRHQPRNGDGPRLRAVPAAGSGRCHPQRAAARRRGPHHPAPMGGPDPPGLECPLHVAEVRNGRAERVLRRGAVRARRTRHLAHAADQGHEPGLHR